MSASRFLDTNVLVYPYDDRQAKKQIISRELLTKALLGDFLVATQVLAEFASTLLHKFATKVAPEKLIVLLDGLDPVKVIPPDAEMVRRAVGRAR